MSHEFPSDAELSQIEDHAAVQAAKINASLGDIDATAAFDFCNGCVRLAGHSVEEAEAADALIGWSLQAGGGFNGAVVNMELVFPDGTKSQSMLLGRYPGDMFTGRMVDHAKAEAARRTQNCQRPKKVPGFMGPLAVKKCPAIERYRDDF